MIKKNDHEQGLWLFRLVRREFLYEVLRIEASALRWLGSVPMGCHRGLDNQVCRRGWHIVQGRFFGLLRFFVCDYDLSRIQLVEKIRGR